MTTQKAAMEQAIEALEQCRMDEPYRNFQQESDAITALRAALAETAEPVAGWKLVPANLTQDMADSAKVVDGRLSVWKYADVYRAMLAAAPQPPAPAVGLTDAELDIICGQTIAKNGRFNLGYLNEFARAAIAAHEKKRGGV